MSRATLASVRPFITVWIALLLLLSASFGSAYLALGAWNSVINIGIAVAKALLVMIFFMHLKRANGLNRVVAFAAFFWLVVLIGLSLSDVLSR